MNVKELRKKSGLTQDELAAKTGIPRARIAKWEQGLGNPKSADERTLMGIFEKLLREQVPHETKRYPEFEETGQILNEDDPNEEKYKEINRAAKGQQMQSEAILKLSESNRLIAESNTILSRSNEELVGLLKAAIAGVHAETQASVDAMLIGLRELLLETAAGHRYKSVEEAGAAYRKKLGDALKKKKAAGIHAG